MAVGRSALAVLGWEHPKYSSRVGILGTSGMVDIAGSASHEARSTDHIVANTLNLAGTADIADTELHPNMDSSRDHMPEPVHRGCSRQSNLAV